MRYLSLPVLQHLTKWCYRQFPDHHVDVFNGMMSFLESVPEHERERYLDRSWWHAYDIAKAAGFIPYSHTGVVRP